MGFSIFLLVSGIVSIVYFVFYLIVNGLNEIFLCAWAVLGVGCIGWSFLHRMIIQKELVTARRVEHVVMGVIGALLFVFVIMLGIIIKDAYKKPEAKADYVIILGAHVFGERMSTNLRYRVEAACEYLKENPQTKAVLSGGQGHGEDITEAEAMRRYLVEQGIPEGRLLLDETSANTEQNIANSAELIGSKDKKVVIVSNDFHIYRAKKIAKKQGYKCVDGLGSKTHPHTIPNSYTREVIAVLKYKLCGQI